MDAILSTLFCCSAVMSVISLVYMTVTPLLSKKYSAKWMYYIWLPVVIGWVFPFRPHLGANIVPFHMPQVQVTQSKFAIVNEQMNIIGNGTGGTSSIPFWLAAACIWSIGVAGIIVFHALRHRRFLKMVSRWSENITNHEILHILENLKTEMNIEKPVDLRCCLSVSTPMMIGFLHPAILLPSLNYDPDELKFILGHELIHLKRHDLWYKALVLLTTAVHWFNPVVYFMARAIDIQCEISCDELLVYETSLMRRRQYGETLIGAIRNRTNVYTALSTDFYSPGNIIKTRIYHIMDTTKKSAGVIILGLVFIAVIGSGIAYASDLPNGSSKSMQVINIDVKELKKGNIILYKGPYKLEAGDILRYNITSDNNEDLYVDVIRDNTLTYGKSIMTQNFSGYILKYPDCRLSVTKMAEGKYTFLVKYKNLEGARNIKGTIKIMKGEGNN